ncbi:MAG: TIGR04086 family membrane protein [Oscillospiraceae bacterium]|nr:TIGR04086 family membrane protein [Oscillospiraceae bacterium]
MQFYKKGVIAGVLSLIAFVITSTILFATVMMLVDVPNEIISIAGTLILSTGCLLASYVSTQIVRNRGLVQGLIVSGIVSSALLIVCLVAHRTLTVSCFEKIICCTLFSVIGGIKGINTRKTGK